MSVGTGGLMPTDRGEVVQNTQQFSGLSLDARLLRDSGGAVMEKKNSECPIRRG